MKRKVFKEVLQSANEALAHAQGRRDLRTTVLPPPPKTMGAREVRRLRARLKASQAVFAGYLNVSTKLVQAWEAGRRSPGGAALRLLRLVEHAPDLLITERDAVPLAARAARKTAARTTALERRTGRRGARSD